MLRSLHWSTKSKETVGKISLWQQMWMRKNRESERRAKRREFFFQTRLMALAQIKVLHQCVVSCRDLSMRKSRLEVANATEYKEPLCFFWSLCVMFATVPRCQVWDIEQAMYESILDCYSSLHWSISCFVQQLTVSFLSLCERTLHTNNKLKKIKIPKFWCWFRTRRSLTTCLVPTYLFLDVRRFIGRCSRQDAGVAEAGLQQRDDHKHKEGSSDHRDAARQVFDQEGAAAERRTGHG